MTTRLPTAQLFVSGRGILVFLSAILSGLPYAGAQPVPDYREYGRLLETYVMPGGVNYDGWHQSALDQVALDNLLAEWSKVDPDSLSRTESTAFLINLYNAVMIDQVLEHYPINSVRDIGLLPFAVFRRDIIALNGEKVSLDEIEKGRLLKDYFDPRIHFAVNCASISCPPLRATPYTGGTLDQQLEEQTRLFAESPHAARIGEDGETTYYSELFKWYQDDFPGENPAVYLNRFRDEPLPVENRVGWIDYDWNLNEVP